MRNKVVTVSIIFLLFSVFFLISGCDDFSLIEILSNDISLIPEEITLDLGETVEFKVSAGISPFIFTELGNGTIPNGIYTAPDTGGEFIISVEDDRKRTAESYVIVLDAASLVSISPEIVSTGINGVVQFTISGGTGPFDVDLDPGLGTHNHPSDSSLLFDYTAGSVAGQETIKVTDSNSQISEASVTILNTSDLMIIPEVVDLLAGEVVTFSASGGTPIPVPPGTAPYQFSVLFDNGDDGIINPDNGRYTAPLNTGTKTISVTDNTTATAEALVYIVADLLTINPSVAITLYVGDEFTFSASNGKSPYVFSILDNEDSASINSSTGLFTALVKDNNVTVVVEDARGTISTCRVKIKD